MKAKIFFDMDGVLAKWDTASSVEDTFLPGYFLSRDADASMVESLNGLIRRGYDVHVLSAVYPGAIYQEEKRQWLLNNGITAEPIFLPCGDNKANYVALEAGQKGILIDDYTRNLNLWESSGTAFVGIKYLNGINSTKGTWRGFRVSHKMDVPHIVNTIAAIANL
jgi:hypothetical protein